MMQHNHLPDWMQEIRRGKALASMVGAATVTDSKGNALELDRIQPDGTIADKQAEEDAPAEDSVEKVDSKATEEPKAEQKAPAKKATTKKVADVKSDDKPAAKKPAPKKKTAAKDDKSQ